MKHTRFAQESAAQAQAEAREKHTSDMRPHGSDRFGNPCECEGCEEWDAQSRAEARKATILNALLAARDHLEYCGYGDKWERECAFAAKLPELLETAIKEASK